MQRQIAQLQRQYDSLKRDLAAHAGHTPEDLRLAIVKKMAATDKFINAKQSELAALKEQRDRESALSKENKETASKLFDEIYGLLADPQHIADANKEFKSNQAFLKKNLDEEHYTALKMTLDQQNASAPPSNRKEREAASAADNKEAALKMFDEIYALLSDPQHIADAAKKFKDNQSFLKKNLDDDHYTALKTTLEHMK